MNNDNGDLANQTIAIGGLTLRDYFAGQALAGLLSNPKLEKSIRENGGARGGWIEESAWSWANAMIELRDKVHD